MDQRRRTTALASDGPAGNAVPSNGSLASLATATAKKGTSTTAASRMSMIPQSIQRSRISSAGGWTGTASGVSQSHSQESVRRSTMNFHSGVMTNKAAGKIDLNLGTTPQSHRNLGGIGSSRRQSSLQSAPRPTTFPSTIPTTRDTRPLRSAVFQQACRENVELFCHTTRCPVPVNDRVLTSPTQKDFYQLFKWLITDFLDPNYPWAAKTFGDDIIAILKDLRYPGLENISKTALGAPGSGTNWGTLLGMLSWLVDLSKAHQSWHDVDVIDDPLLSDITSLPLNHPLLEDRLSWNYISKMYVMWFRGDGEEFPEAHAELADAYDRIQQAALEEADTLETILQKRTVELQQLQVQEPPLKALEDEYLRLMSDKTKFINFIEMHRQKAERIKQGTAKAKAIIADHDQQLELARSDLSAANEAVLMQNLSPEEVQRMNHERDTLSRNLDDLRSKINDANTHMYDQEIMVTKAVDRFDQLLSDYGTLGTQIGTLSSPTINGMTTTSPPGIDRTNYSLDLDFAILTADDLPVAISTGQRMRGEIWSGLQNYSESYRKQIAHIENDRIALEDENDRLGSKVERQKEEAANLEMRLTVVNEQAEEARSQLQAETVSTNQTISKLEYEVGQILMNTQRGVQDLRSDIETKRIEYNELRHKAANLQDQIQKDLMSHIDIVVRAKEHASMQLKGVRTFAESH